jgi:site-specific DNA recombinase
VARQSSDRLSESQGTGVGKARHGQIVLDPERALLVREAFRLYATGDYSLAELQGALAANGLTSPTARKPGAPPPVSALATMLQNPFYIGVVEWDGVRYPGQHKRLIPKNLFESCQDVLKAHNKAGVRQRRHDHYLKGVLHCGPCGNRLSLTLAKGQYLYFYCLGQKNSLRQTNCTQPYVMAFDAEQGVEDLYRKIQLPEEWVERLTKELGEEIVERQSTAGELRVALTKSLAALAEERQKLLRAYYANAIPLDLLKRDQDRITEQEERAKLELAATEADLDKWQDVLAVAIRLAGSCHAAYLKASPKVRRRFNDARQGQARRVHGRVRSSLFTPEFE